MDGDDGDGCWMLDGDDSGILVVKMVMATTVTTMIVKVDYRGATCDSNCKSFYGLDARCIINNI